MCGLLIVFFSNTSINLECMVVACLLKRSVLGCGLEIWDHHFLVSRTVLTARISARLTMAQVAHLRQGLWAREPHNFTVIIFIHMKLPKMKTVYTYWVFYLKNSFNFLKFRKYSFSYLTLGFWRHNRRRLIWQYFEAILSILSICK